MLAYFFNTRIRKYLYKEFWPKWLLLIPVFIHIFYLCIKARSFFFFSATNPGIPLGWLTWDSKYPLLRQIPKEFLPKTLFIQKWMSSAETVKGLETKKISFPFIAKPDIWEWWVGVEKIHNHKELLNYMKHYDEDFLIQEYIPWTDEITLMYYRIPWHKKGEIAFIATKEFLSVLWDGTSMLWQLVRKWKRTRLFEHIFQKEHWTVRNTIISKWQIYTLQFKWNHGQGTAMFDWSQIITSKLCTVFDEIANHIDWFFLGRYDIKYDNLDTFTEGRSFKILDLNWVWADLHHAYDPKYSLLGLRRIRKIHLDDMYEIARINHKNGTPYATYKEYKQITTSFKSKIQKFKHSAISE
jgi:hypothetical protein